MVLIVIMKLIASGSGMRCNIGGIEVSKVKRKFTVTKTPDGKQGAFQMLGSKLRLGTNSDAKAGLTDKQAKIIINNYKNTLSDESKNKSVPAKRYFEDSTVTRNPLLIIYPVELNNEDNSLNEIEKNYKNDTLIGIGIGIPVFNDTNTYQSSTYIVNMRKYKEYNGFDDNDIEIDEIENE